MASYTELALDVLKQHGLRITKPRRLVLELLDRSRQPLSAYEIRDRLATEGEKVDIVSVYRILECLEAHELIHRLLSSGKVRKCSLEPEEHCHRHQEEHCHHFLLCRQCNAVEEVHCPGSESMVDKLEGLSRFKIESHSMEFIGLCPRCQQA